jgi:CMP-N-acetylneuraminic acid synthetase
MKVFALIAARAGSKGVKNKYMLPMMGKTVLGWVIHDALAARCIDMGDIWVTTDSPEIETEAKLHGARAIMRPPELGVDRSRIDYIVRHALSLWNEPGPSPDIIAYLGGNAPVRESGLIDRCVQLLVSQKCDSVRSMTPVGNKHPDWMFEVDGEGRMSSYLPDFTHKPYRRQELCPRLYVHDGAVIAVTADAVRKSALKQFDDNFCVFGEDARGVVSAPGGTVEIDDAGDVFAAEAALKARGT